MTADKDFGELIYRQRRASRGVLLLRLAGIEPTLKAQWVRRAVEEHGPKLAEAFSVLTPGNLRIRREIRQPEQ